MSENQAEIADLEGELDANSSAKKTKLYVIVGVVAMLVTAGAVYQVMHSREQAMAQSLQDEMNQRLLWHSGKGHVHRANNRKETVEVSLGQFNTSVRHVDRDATMRVRFHLVATIAKDKKKIFVEEFDKQKHRVRDEIIARLSHVKMEDLADANLHALRAQITGVIKRHVERVKINSLVFSEYKVREQ